MPAATQPVLILACGNTLRSDDGVGPWLAEWAAQRFPAQSDVRILAPLQWTPELAEDIALARAVLFVDCAINTAPGQLDLIPITPAPAQPGLATHHLGAPQLLSLAQQLYGAYPSAASLLTVGAGSTELGERFSPAVQAVLPSACSLLQDVVRDLISSTAPLYSA